MEKTENVAALDRMKGVKMRTSGNRLKAGLASVILSSLFCAVVLAGIRGPGKHNGVVIFDRWGACYLYSGIYIMPISEKVKASLLAFDGKPILIDAQEVYQPMNPGDALIRKLEVLGTALEPFGPTAWRHPVLDGLTLTVVPDFSEQNQLTIELRNTGTSRREIDLDALGPTLLAKKKRNGWIDDWLEVADGPSYALITRCSLKSSCMRDGEGILPASDAMLPVSIDPNQTVKVPLVLQLSPGEYEFVAGYGGGVHEVRTLVSNMVAFDIDEAGRLTPGRDDYRVRAS